MFADPPLFVRLGNGGGIVPKTHGVLLIEFDRGVMVLKVDEDILEKEDGIKRYYKFIYF